MTKEQIRQKALELHNNKKKWHFHILTPKCLLNQSKEYVLMLENSSDDESFVYYSEEPMMELGKELVKLLHGDDIIAGDKVTKEPSKEVKIILERAEELNKKGKYWHHHMLFPDCIFNKDKGKWSIVFEDTTKGDILRALYDSEPKNDLSLIEILYYEQKGLA